MKRTLVSLLVAVSITMTACGGAGSSSQGQQADAAQETAEAGQAEQDAAEAGQEAAEAGQEAAEAGQEAAEAGQEAAEPAKEDATGEITYVEQELCGCKFSRPDKWIQFPSDDTSEQFIFDVKKDESGVSVSFTQADIAGLEKGLETMAEEWEQVGEANGFVLEEIRRVEGMPNETYVVTGTRSAEGFPSKYRGFFINTDDVGALSIIEFFYDTEDAESQAEVDKMIASVDVSGVKDYVEANPAP